MGAAPTSEGIGMNKISEKSIKSTTFTRSFSVFILFAFLIVKKILLTPDIALTSSLCVCTLHLFKTHRHEFGMKT